MGDHGLSVPVEVQHFLEVVLGVAVPEGSVRGLYGLAGDWDELVGALEGLERAVGVGGVGVGSALVGEVGRVSGLWLSGDAVEGLSVLVGGAREAAKLSRNAGADVVKAFFLLSVMALVALATIVELAWTVVGALLVPVVEAGARVAALALVEALKARLAGLTFSGAARGLGRVGVQAGKFGVVGAGFMGGLDFGFQVGQVLVGAREGLDGRSVVGSVVGGVLGGAFAGVAHAGAVFVRDTARKLEAGSGRGVEFPGYVRALGHVGYGLSQVGMVVVSAPAVNAAVGTPGVSPFLGALGALGAMGRGGRAGGGGGGVLSSLDGVLVGVGGLRPPVVTIPDTGKPADTDGKSGGIAESPATVAEKPDLLLENPSLAEPVAGTFALGDELEKSVVAERMKPADEKFANEAADAFTYGDRAGTPPPPYEAVAPTVVSPASGATPYGTLFGKPDVAASRGTTSPIGAPTLGGGKLTAAADAHVTGAPIPPPAREIVAGTRTIGEPSEGATSFLGRNGLPMYALSSETAVKPEAAGGTVASSGHLPSGAVYKSPVTSEPVRESSNPLSATGELPVRTSAVAPRPEGGIPATSEPVRSALAVHLTQSSTDGAGAFRAGERYVDGVDETPVRPHGPGAAELPPGTLTLGPKAAKLYPNDLADRVAITAIVDELIAERGTLESPHLIIHLSSRNIQVASGHEGQLRKIITDARERASMSGSAWTPQYRGGRPDVEFDVKEPGDATVLLYWIVKKNPTAKAEEIARISVESGIRGGMTQLRPTVALAIKEAEKWGDRPKHLRTSEPDDMPQIDSLIDQFIRIYDSSSLREFYNFLRERNVSGRESIFRERLTMRRAARLEAPHAPASAGTAVVEPGFLGRQLDVGVAGDRELIGRLAYVVAWAFKTEGVPELVGRLAAEGVRGPEAELAGFVQAAVAEADAHGDRLVPAAVGDPALRGEVRRRARGILAEMPQLHTAERGAVELVRQLRLRHVTGGVNEVNAVAGEFLSLSPGQSLPGGVADDYGENAVVVSSPAGDVVAVPLPHAAGVAFVTAGYVDNVLRAFAQAPVFPSDFTVVVHHLGGSYFVPKAGGGIAELGPDGLADTLQNLSSLPDSLWAWSAMALSANVYACSLSLDSVSDLQTAFRRTDQLAHVQVAAHRLDARIHIDRGGVITYSSAVDVAPRPAGTLSLAPGHRPIAPLEPADQAAAGKGSLPVETVAKPEPVVLSSGHSSVGAADKSPVTPEPAREGPLSLSAKGERPVRPSSAVAPPREIGISASSEPVRSALAAYLVQSGSDGGDGVGAVRAAEAAAGGLDEALVKASGRSDADLPPGTLTLGPKAAKLDPKNIAHRAAIAKIADEVVAERGVLESTLLLSHMNARNVHVGAEWSGQLRKILGEARERSIAAGSAWSPRYRGEQHALEFDTDNPGDVTVLLCWIAKRNPAAKLPEVVKLAVDAGIHGGVSQLRMYADRAVKAAENWGYRSRALSASKEEDIPAIDALIDRHIHNVGEVSQRKVFEFLRQNNVSGDDPPLRRRLENRVAARVDGHDAYEPESSVVAAPSFMGRQLDVGVAGDRELIGRLAYVVAWAFKTEGVPELVGRLAAEGVRGSEAELARFAQVAVVEAEVHGDRLVPAAVGDPAFRGEVRRRAGLILAETPRLHTAEGGAVELARQLRLHHVTGGINEVNTVAAEFISLSSGQSLPGGVIEDYGDNVVVVSSPAGDVVAVPLPHAAGVAFVTAGYVDNVLRAFAQAPVFPSDFTVVVHHLDGSYFVPKATGGIASLNPDQLVTTLDNLSGLSVPIAGWAMTAISANVVACLMTTDSEGALQSALNARDHLGHIQVRSYLRDAAIHIHRGGAITHTEPGDTTSQPAGTLSLGPRTGVLEEPPRLPAIEEEAARFVEELFDELDEHAPPPTLVRQDSWVSIQSAHSDVVDERTLESQYGISLRDQRRFQKMTDRFGVVIDVRPTNPASVAWRARGAVPKPLEIKAKTLNALDVHLGMRREQIGLVGYFRPHQPDLTAVPEELREPVLKRYHARSAEYTQLAGDMDRLRREGRFQVVDGLVQERRADGFRNITGDNDLYDIRLPEDGASLYQADYDRMVYLLVGRELGVEHGAMKYWEPQTEFQRKIRDDIDEQHRTVPLVRFAPALPAALIYLTNDRSERRPSIAPVAAAVPQPQLSMNYRSVPVDAELFESVRPIEARVRTDGEFPVFGRREAEVTTQFRPVLRVAQDSTLAINGTRSVGDAGGVNEAREFFATPEVLERSREALRRTGTGVELVAEETRLVLDQDGREQVLHRVVARVPGESADASRDFAQLVHGGTPDTLLFETPGGGRASAPVNAEDGLEVTGTYHLAEGLAEMVDHGDLSEVDAGRAALIIGRDQRETGGLPGRPLPGSRYGQLLDQAPEAGERWRLLGEAARRMGVNQFAWATPGRLYLRASIPEAGSGGRSGAQGLHFATVIAESADGRSQITLENRSHAAELDTAVRAAIDRNLAEHAGDLERIAADLAERVRDAGDTTDAASLRRHHELADALREIEETGYDAAEAGARRRARRAMAAEIIGTPGPRRWHFRMYTKEPGETFFDQQALLYEPGSAAPGVNPLVTVAVGGLGDIAPAGVWFTGKTRTVDDDTLAGVRATARATARAAVLRADLDLPRPEVTVTGYGDRGRAGQVAAHFRRTLANELKALQGDHVTVRAEDVRLHVETGTDPAGDATEPRAVVEVGFADPRNIPEHQAVAGYDRVAHGLRELELTRSELSGKVAEYAELAAEGRLEPRALPDGTRERLVALDRSLAAFSDAAVKGRVRTLVNEAVLAASLVPTRERERRPKLSEGGSEVDRRAIQPIPPARLTQLLGDLNVPLARGRSPFTGPSSPGYGMSVPPAADLSVRLTALGMINLVPAARVSLAREPLFQALLRNPAALREALFAGAGHEEQYFLNTCVPATVHIGVRGRVPTIAGLLQVGRAVVDGTEQGLDGVPAEVRNRRDRPLGRSQEDMVRKRVADAREEFAAVERRAVHLLTADQASPAVRREWRTLTERWGRSMQKLAAADLEADPVPVLTSKVVRGNWRTSLKLTSPLIVDRGARRLTGVVRARYSRKFRSQLALEPDGTLFGFDELTDDGRSGVALAEVLDSEDRALAFWRQVAMDGGTVLQAPAHPFHVQAVTAAGRPAFVTSNAMKSYPVLQTPEEFTGWAHSWGARARVKLFPDLDVDVASEVADGSVFGAVAPEAEPSRGGPAQTGEPSGIRRTPTDVSLASTVGDISPFDPRRTASEVGTGSSGGLDLRRISSPEGRRASVRPFSTHDGYLQVPVRRASGGHAGAFYPTFDTALEAVGGLRSAFVTLNHLPEMISEVAEGNAAGPVPSVVIDSAPEVAAGLVEGSGSGVRRTRWLELMDAQGRRYGVGFARSGQRGDEITSAVAASTDHAERIVAVRSAREDGETLITESLQDWAPATEGDRTRPVHLILEGENGRFVAPGHEGEAVSRLDPQAMAEAVAALGFFREATGGPVRPPLIVTTHDVSANPDVRDLNRGFLTHLRALTGPWQAFEHAGRLTFGRDFGVPGIERGSRFSESLPSTDEVRFFSDGSVFAISSASGDAEVRAAALASVARSVTGPWKDRKPLYVVLDADRWRALAGIGPHQDLELGGRPVGRMMLSNAAFRARLEEDRTRPVVVLATDSGGRRDIGGLGFDFAGALHEDGFYPPVYGVKGEAGDRPVFVPVSRLRAGDLRTTDISRPDGTLAARLLRAPGDDDVLRRLRNWATKSTEPTLGTYVRRDGRLVEAPWDRAPVLLVAQRTRRGYLGTRRDGLVGSVSPAGLADVFRDDPALREGLGTDPGLPYMLVGLGGRTLGLTEFAAGMARGGYARTAYGPRGTVTFRAGSPLRVDGPGVRAVEPRVPRPRDIVSHPSANDRLGTFGQFFPSRDFDGAHEGLAALGESRGQQQYYIREMRRTGADGLPEYVPVPFRAPWAGRNPWFTSGHGGMPSGLAFSLVTGDRFRRGDVVMLGDAPAARAIFASEIYLAAQPDPDEGLVLGQCSTNVTASAKIGPTAAFGIREGWEREAGPMEIWAASEAVAVARDGERTVRAGGAFLSAVAPGVVPAQPQPLWSGLAQSGQDDFVESPSLAAPGPVRRPGIQVRLDPTFAGFSDDESSEADAFSDDAASEAGGDEQSSPERAALVEWSERLGQAREQVEEREAVFPQEVAEARSRAQRLVRAVPVAAGAVDEEIRRALHEGLTVVLTEVMLTGASPQAAWSDPVVTELRETAESLRGPVAGAPHYTMLPVAEMAALHDEVTGDRAPEQ
ncbi:hypothetical protein [Amycolatopsis sp. WQ 127309]|uniref:hypothetical protein n=1 Tax=Amycolatopsis sp. WQ 127309 TaxID=2932773 RepID=UPI001FF6E72C|nr:hypothetical protein [Amycolatopsis sp. WQ 127309]UOZ06976.1 hypothetical protein MUY22_01385 [Amycolatopsis sp. WQ 127309]